MTLKNESDPFKQAHKKAEHLVVDSAIFLRPCRLEDFGEKIYTVKGVVEEIRDKEARRRMSVLPYELIYREPDSESVKIITDFSKKTGDYPVLSATDIQVLALAHTLHKEHIGVENLRTEPIRTVQVTKKPEPISTENLPGFYKPTKKEEEEEEIVEEVIEEEEDDDEEEEEEAQGEPGDEKEENQEEEEDDDNGWITPGNIQKLSLRRFEDADQEDVKVACITTDFAMQNVLKQMNLVAMGVDGVVIKQIRTYILRCFACFKTTSDTSRKFCQSCGNKTLKRVGVTVLPDGTRKIHISRRPLNLRGLKYSLPLPKSGKHAHNPVVAEGQPGPQQKPSKKSLQKINALDPEYAANDSPFAVNDVYSKAAQRGYVRHGSGLTAPTRGKKNPNESHNPHRRRKKVSGF